MFVAFCDHEAANSTFAPRGSSDSVLLATIGTVAAPAPGGGAGPRLKSPACPAHCGSPPIRAAFVATVAHHRPEPEVLERIRGLIVLGPLSGAFGHSSDMQATSPASSLLTRGCDIATSAVYNVAPALIGRAWWPLMHPHGAWGRPGAQHGRVGDVLHERLRGGQLKGGQPVGPGWRRSPDGPPGQRSPSLVFSTPAPRTR